MIKTAIIGLGRLGITHVVNLLNIQNIELCIVCDHKLEIAEKVATTYKIPRFTDNPEHIWNDSTIQAVVIVTSTTSHYEMVRKALTSEKAVFVEKPLTIDLHQSIELNKLIKSTNGFCQVGFMRRFDPDYLEAKKLIQSGAIGKPIYFKSLSRDPSAPPLSFIERSGGIFIDLMIHDMDLAHYLMGEIIVEIAAFGGILKNPHFKAASDIDQALVFAKFESGSIGDMEGSRNAFYGYDVRTEIIGTEGTLLIGDNKQSNVHILDATGNRHHIIPFFQGRFTTAYVNELSAFASCIEQQQSPLCSIEDSIQALKVAHTATQSYKQNGLLLATNVKEPIT